MSSERERERSKREAVLKGSIMSEKKEKLALLSVTVVVCLERERKRESKHKR